MTAESHDCLDESWICVITGIRSQTDFASNLPVSCNGALYRNCAFSDTTEQQRQFLYVTDWEEIFSCSRISSVANSWRHFMPIMPPGYASLFDTRSKKARDKYHMKHYRISAVQIVFYVTSRGCFHMFLMCFTCLRDLCHFCIYNIFRVAEMA